MSNLLAKYARNYSVDFIIPTSDEGLVAFLKSKLAATSILCQHKELLL